MAAPSLYHWLPLAELEVSVTEPPWQKVVVPAVTVGAGGNGFTVTSTSLDTGLEHTLPSVTTTVYLPLAVAV